MTSLQNALAKLHHRSHAYLVGNGTAGLYCILKARGFRDALVGIPNSVCMNVPLAVKFSGNQPVYLDISKDNLGLSVAALVNCTQPLQAVIAVHAYGSVCSIEEIISHCRANNIFLIEDVAVAQGATVLDEPAGAFGDVSLLSFGRGKIVSVGHGGAILTDDEYLLSEIARIEQRFPDHSESLERRVFHLDRYYTQLYNDHYGKDLSRYSSLFNRVAMEARDAFLFRFDLAYAERIHQGVTCLEQNIAIRGAHAKALTDRFVTHGITVFDPPAGSVRWRYNIFLEREKRDLILRKLLQQKHKISSWFPSVDLFFEDRREASINTPTSDWVGDSILNIWVNDEIDETYLEEVSAEIVQVVK